MSSTFNNLHYDIYTTDDILLKIDREAQGFS